MAVNKATLLRIEPSYPDIGAYVFYQDGNTPVEERVVYIDSSYYGNWADIIAGAKAAILAYAATQGYTGLTDPDDILLDPGDGLSQAAIEALIAGSVPEGFENAPQAAIADAPTDAVTNYNTVTTLLGTLTGAVNTANAKQNEIATKLNTLLAELRTLGLISS